MAELRSDVEVFRDTECIGFPRHFIGLPDFFVDYKDHGVARVSFNTSLDVLDKDRVHVAEFVSY